MRHFTFLAIACSACGSSGDSTATISGHVYLDGLTDHSGVFVFSSGRQLAEDTVVSDANGAYSVRISAQRDARYFVTAQAPSTLERQKEIFIDVHGGDSPIAPDFHFTPVGILTGTVKLSGAASSAGVLVAVEGTSAVATTDDSGAYILRDVPVGPPGMTRVIVALKDGYQTLALPGQSAQYGQTTPVQPIALTPK